MDSSCGGAQHLQIFPPGDANQVNPNMHAHLLEESLKGGKGVVTSKRDEQNQGAAISKWGNQNVIGCNF
ncbi:hypothetical protein PVPAM_060019900 [Plasmodium vivax]|nr:hypothetical protein PVPAM_060019900 [Plasmodium vivax]